MSKIITIDGQDFNVERFSREAKVSLTSYQYADDRIKALQYEIAMVETALKAYGRSLSSILPNEASAEKESNVILINDKKYSSDEFNEEGRALIFSVDKARKKLTELEADLALFKTARGAYKAALRNELKSA